MKKLLTYGGAIFALLVLMVIGIVVYITVFFNPNELKPQIINAVKQRTGIELSLQGPLSWTFFPDVGLKAQNVVVRVPNQIAHSPDLAHVAEIEVSVQVLPLLGKHVIVKGIELDHPQFELYKDAQGHTNWQVAHPSSNLDYSHDNVFTPTFKRQGPPDSAETHPRTESVTHGAAPLSISHFSITGGAIHYVDDSPKKESEHTPFSVELHNVNLNASNVSLAHMFPLKLTFDASAAYFQKGHIALNAEVTPDQLNNRYIFDHVRLEGQGIVPKLNQSEEQQFSLNVPTLIADMAHHRYQANDAHVDFVLHPSALKGKAVPVSVNSSMVADLAGQTLDFSNLTIHSHDQLNIHGQVAISQLMTDARYSGVIHLQSNLHEWLQGIGIDVSGMPVEALSHVQGVIQSQGDRSHKSVANIHGQVDSTPFNGEATLNFAASDYAFQLNTGALDLDHYLTQSTIREGADDGQEIAHSSPANADVGSSSTKAAALPASEAHHEGDVSTPFSFLRQRRIQGVVTMDALTLHRIRLDHIALNANSDDGLVPQLHLTARGYGGNIDVNGSADTQHMPLSLTLQPNVSNLALGELLADVSPGLGQRLDGTLSASGVFSTEGNGAADFQRHLSGQGQINVTHGRVNGVDIPGQVCRATTLLRKHTLTNDVQGSTPIQQLNGSYVIQQGVVTVNGINASLPGFSMNGHGSATLPTHHFDFPLTLAFADNQTLTQCGVPSSLFKINIPLRCEGDMYGPPALWCRLNDKIIRQSLEQHIGDDVKERGNKGIDKALQSKTGQRIKNALEGLFH